jgi:hypothetical protein
MVEDCCGALTKPEHEAALHNMRSYFGRVLNSRAIAVHWRSLGQKEALGENQSAHEAPKRATRKVI